MSYKSYLDSVESKAYRTFFKDGTWDMFFGLFLIGLAAGTGLFLTDLLTNKTASILTASLSFGLAGIFLSVIGLILFLRFLKEYPKQDLTVHDEKEY